MTTVVGPNTIGEGFSTRDTHGMGANGKIGVKGNGFTNASSWPASSTLSQISPGVGRQNK